MHFRIVHSAQFCVWYEKCQLIGAVGVFESYFLSISFMTNRYETPVKTAAVTQAAGSQKQASGY